MRRLWLYILVFALILIDTRGLYESIFFCKTCWAEFRAD